MATLQQVNSSPRWPTVATPSLLPNVAGSPTQRAQLQVGDECLCTVDGCVYVCAVATLGAAVWSAQVRAAPNEVIVRSEACLPAPVAGVITLAANTIYSVFGVVTLTPGNSIVSPATTLVRGRLALLDQIVGDVNGPLVSYVDAVSTDKFDLRNLGLQNTNTGASSTALTANAPNGTLRIEQCRVVGGLHGLALTACASASLLSTAFTAANGGDALRVSGTVVAIAADLSSFQTSGVNGNGISILAGATVTTLTVTQTGFVLLAVTSAGIRKDPAATVTTVYVTRAVPFGVGTLNAGWDQGTLGWTVQASPPLPDSVAGGGSTITTGLDFTRAFAASGTYYDVTDGLAHYALNPGSERFSLVSNVNGEIRYIGTKTRRFLLQGMVNASKAGTAVIGDVTLAVGGAPVAASSAQVQVDTRINAFPTMPVVVLLAPNDTIKVQIKNETNTNSFTIHTAGITVTGLGT